MLGSFCDHCSTTWTILEISELLRYPRLCKSLVSRYRSHWETKSRRTKASRYGHFMRERKGYAVAVYKTYTYSQLFRRMAARYQCLYSMPVNPISGPTFPLPRMHCANYEPSDIQTSSNSLTLSRQRQLFIS